MQFRQPTATEISELGQLASQTFGFPHAKFALTVERIGAENLRVAVEDGKLNGGLAVYRLEQWLGGRAIPMALHMGHLDQIQLMLHLLIIHMMNILIMEQLKQVIME